jgi:endonuclease YncB( thermonuclease family)
MLDTIYVLGTAFATFLILVYFFRPQPLPLEPERKYGQVSYIFDGDTLQIEGIKPRIRLWGVDAPEVGRKGAQVATDALEKLSKRKKVSYIPVDTDKYGRVVARVFLADGREINCLLIGQGVVKQYRKYSKGFYDNCQP